MRLLQSITYYLPYVSGITIYAHRLGEELTKRGYKIIVATSQYKPNLKQDEEMNGVHIKRASVLFWVSKGPIMPKWAFAIWREMGETDIVLIHLPQFEGVITAILAKLKGKALISIYHCEVTLPKGFFNSFVGRILDISQYITCRLADRIVVYTMDYAKHSRIASRFLKKTVQIYPPIKVQSAKRKVQSEKLKRLNNIKGAKIGFAGRIAAEKGLEYLIEAVRLLQAKGLPTRTDRPPEKKFKLIIAGAQPVGESKYMQKIKKLVKQVKTEIVFLGNLSQEELVVFYKSIDVLVLPSVNSTEAFGLVQVEAMLCGTPVVATDLPGVSAPIQETGMGEIVPPRDSEALAEAIADVVHNKKLYTKPREKIKKLFNTNTTITKYIDLFNSLKP